MKVLSFIEVRLTIIHPLQSSGKATHQSGNKIRVFNLIGNNQNTPFEELYCNTTRFIFFSNSKLLQQDMNKHLDKILPLLFLLLLV